MGEGKGGMFQENSIETCILSRVKQITSPCWRHETSARTRCTGKTQRDWVEREVGGDIGKGNLKKKKKKKNTVGTWIGVALNLYIALGRIEILTILIFPIN